MDPRYSLAGLIVGACVGFSGVGGGSLMTPLLILLFQINPLVAVGTDLLYSVPTKILGAIVHGRQGSIDRKVVTLLSAGAIPSALVALLVLAQAHHRIDPVALDRMLRHAIGVAILGAAVLIVVTPFLRRRNAVPESLDAARSIRIVVIGVFTGFVVTITSIGSGAFTLPLLLLLLGGFEVRVLVGSDIAFGAILVPVAAAGHWSMNNVNLPVCAALLVGSLPGVYIGSRLSRVLPGMWLRPALAVILAIAGSRIV